MKRFLYFVVGVSATLTFLKSGYADERVKLAVQGRLGNDRQVVELRNLDAVRSGDGLRFSLSVDRSSYVYLLAFGSSGKLVALQPFSGAASDAHQQSGERRDLPPAGHFLELDESPGRELLFAFGVGGEPINLSRLLDELKKLDNVEQVRDRIESKYPRVVTFELQHLPGILKLRPPGRPVSGANVAGQRIDRGGAEKVKGSVVAEETDVLGAEGTLISRLRQDETSHSNLASLPHHQRVNEGLGAVLAPKENSFPPKSDTAALSEDSLGKKGSLVPEFESTLGSSVDVSVDSLSTSLVLVTGTRNSGSGALVGDGRYVLVPWHLVNGENKVSVLPRVRGGQGNQAPAVTAKVLRGNEFTDLALLELAAPFNGAQPVIVGRGSIPLRVGEQVHVVSHDENQDWRHALAIVVQTRDEQSWFSNERVIHRGPTIELQMARPPRQDGALIINQAGELVGLKVRSGRARGSMIAVAGQAIRAFLTVLKH